MNNKTKTIFTLSIVLALILGIGIGGYAATNYGTSSDPLITLSYLDETMKPELLAEFQKQLDAKEAELEKKFTELMAAQSSITSDTYHVVTLRNGQTLTGKVGCEIMLRIGTATCSASSNPGLIDASAGGSINDSAALSTNHLYMVTIEGNGIKATASSVKVLVRGEYTIK